MAWETRRNGRSYYYHKEREGRRVVSRYVGGGDIGELSAMVDQIARVRRGREMLEKQGSPLARRVDEQIEQQVNQLNQLIRDLTGAAMLLGGCHLHKRQWRRRRKRYA